MPLLSKAFNVSCYVPNRSFNNDKITYSSFSFSLFSCGLKDDEEVTIVLAKYQLKDGTMLLVQKKEGGYLGAPHLRHMDKKN
jgi:hypothetical protein